MDVAFASVSTMKGASKGKTVKSCKKLHHAAHSDVKAILYTNIASQGCTEHQTMGTPL